MPAWGDAITHRARVAASVIDASDTTRTRTQLSRSTIMAMPWPPPTHMVSRPIVPPVLEPIEERGHDAGARHPERVAEGDRAAMDVQLVEEMPSWRADGTT